MSFMLEARGLMLRAGGRTLLDDVSLWLDAGERVALVGPNGAGKSSLLRILAGEWRPHAGTVSLKGKRLAAYAPRTLARHRAVLSQSVHVAFPFTVAEVVAMGAPDRRGAALDALVVSALAQVDLAAFGHRVITTLSGGEQQRTHLARVLVQLACGEAAHGPGLLLLDEPTASLDLRHQLDVLDAVRRCAERGVAVIAVLHDLNLAALFADRIIVLHGGRIAAEGRPHETINEATLARVFGVTASVGQAPPPGMPFVLPQTIARA
jgi:iron complex transport system ATP-binding protein